VPLPHWCSCIIGTVESVSLPVPLVWTLGGVAGLVVRSGFRPWWQNADLAGLGPRDIVLCHDGRRGYPEFLCSARSSYGLMAWVLVTLGTITKGGSFP
jgi:hypothetical protein